MSLSLLHLNNHHRLALSVVAKIRYAGTSGVVVHVSISLTLCERKWTFSFASTSVPTVASQTVALTASIYHMISSCLQYGSDFTEDE